MAAKRKDKWLKRWCVESFSNSDIKYTVALDREEHYGCSCPAWRFGRKNNPICKHILFVIEMSDRERAAILVKQYNITAPLLTSEWKVFIIEDNSGEVHVGMTRSFGERE